MSTANFEEREIFSVWKYRLGPSESWLMVRPLAWLPNIDGFEFTGVTHSHDSIACVIRKDLDGLHYAIDLKTNRRCFDTLRGWIRKTFN